MSKSLLNQALKFKENNPTFSQIEKLYREAQIYQTHNDVIFLKAKPRTKSEIVDIELFFEFISEHILQSVTVTSFEDIENIMQAKTREENIATSGDSKNSIVRVFDNVIIYQKANTHPILSKEIQDIQTQGPIVAVENGETFLNIYPLMSRFGFQEYIYLGGFSNTLTREFLKDKSVVFFLDYDIEAIRIYDSFTCKSKSFFKHPDIESYFQNHGNQKLYLKQRAALPNKHTELQWLLDLIKTYSVVVEQEIMR